MISMIDLAGLYTQAAEAITKKRVLVRIRKPEYKGYWGMVKNEDGCFMVDLSPGLGYLIQLKVFCHECAHIIKHGIQPTPAGYKHEITKDPGMESQADQLGEKILNMAGPDDWPIEARLKRLIRIYGPGE